MSVSFHASQLPGQVDLLERVLGIVTLIGVADIAATCVIVEVLRTNLNWFTTPMSIYMAGRDGAWVRASFYAPAPGIAAIGIAWYRTLDRNARSLIPVALFIAAALGLCVLASFAPNMNASEATLHGLIHQWAAFGTFVCVTTGALVQSWQVRRDPHWRFRTIPAITVAAIAVVYFWIYALVQPIPRGIGEKVVIGLILLWLWRAAWWLVRGR